MDLPIVSAVLDITQEGDHLSLAHALMRAMGMLFMKGQPFGIAGMTLYEAKLVLVEEATQEQWIAVDVLDPREQWIPLERIVAHESCVEHDRTVMVHEIKAGYAIHLPNSTYYLVIQGKHIAAESRPWMEFLLNLFCNQAILIHSKERDPLTGLYNRRFFDEQMEKLLSSYHGLKKQRKNDLAERGICLAMMDIDHFKQVNDRFGHMIGDEVLVLLTRWVDQSLRYTDMMFRFGGEEFVLVLPNIQIMDAEQILERLRLRVAAYQFPQVGTITVSIGFIAWMPPGDPPLMLIEQADQALYYAKRHGSNRVCSYGQLVAEQAIVPTNFEAVDIEVWK